MQLTDAPTHAPGVISRIIESEAVVVHPQQGKVRVLNPVGARLWELADGQRTVAELAGAIVAEYDVELPRAQADALAFCADLVGRGVLTLKRNE